jgi:endonuclease/exonuclease/phosphatase family metal-dependent hydrolase
MHGRLAYLHATPASHPRIAETMTRLLPLALVMLASSWTAGGQTAPPDNEGPLETGASTKPRKLVQISKDIPIVTYNIRWRTGDELKQISKWLTGKGPLLIALQEVDRSKQRTNKTNTARALAEELGMYYAWAAPPLPKPSKDNEEETGVELLSPYPLRDVTRIVLPHSGPGGRWRVALGATIKLPQTDLRVYSVHAETRIPLDQKLDQYRAVLNDLKRFPNSMPAIVMGDFNSWEPATVKGVRKLFTGEDFTTPFSDDDSTFKRNAVLFDVNLKLDWIWLRGLKATTSAIDRSITTSDHYPLWTIASLGR